MKFKFGIATYSSKLENEIRYHPPPRNVSGLRRTYAAVPMFEESEWKSSEESGPVGGLDGSSKKSLDVVLLLTASLVEELSEMRT